MPRWPLWLNIAFGVIYQVTGWITLENRSQDAFDLLVRWSSAPRHFYGQGLPEGTAP